MGAAAYPVDTFEQIAAHMGKAAKSSAARLVDGLVRQGMLERRPHKPRGLRVPGRPNLATIPTDALRAELARREARSS